MFLRRHMRKKGGTEYESWTLVETVRTARGPRQRIIATIGKLPGLNKEERMGWEDIGRFLSGKPRPHPDLFIPEEERPLWATVDLRGVQIERMRHFGDVYLGLVLWHRLGLSEFCKEEIPTGREEIPWQVMAAVLTLARFCAPSSELQIAESWYAKTALDDLLGVSAERRSMTTGSTGRLMPCCRTRTPCAGICRNAMVSCSGRLSTFSSMTLHPRILKAAASKMSGPSGVTAGTDGLIVCRCALVW